jgi:hypothetical protein
MTDHHNPTMPRLIVHSYTISLDDCGAEVLIFEEG